MFGNLNPCNEIYIVEDFNSHISPERENFRRKIVSHLLNVGWEINHDWLDEVSKKTDPNNNDVLRRTMWGMHDGDYHLTTKCKSFTVRILKDNAVFWRRSPQWKNIIDIPLEEMELTDRGVKYDEIIEIVVN